MRRNHKTSWIVLTTLCFAMVADIAPGQADNATECRLLRAGYNGLSYDEQCYAIDVPDRTDMLRLILQSQYESSLRFTLSDTVDPSKPDLCGLAYERRYCTVPGPEATRFYLHLVSFYRPYGRPSITVEFAQSVAVSGGIVERTCCSPGDARMYRFDGLEGAAIISLASANDFDLFVRRAVPPSRSESDCVSAQHVPHTFVGGAEACRLEAGTGSVYAFVRFIANADETSSTYLPVNPYEVVGGLPFGIEPVPDHLAIFGAAA